MLDDDIVAAYFVVNALTGEKPGLRALPPIELLASVLEARCALALSVHLTTIVPCMNGWMLQW